jgi:transposase-like protein
MSSQAIMTRSKATSTRWCRQLEQTLNALLDAEAHWLSMRRVNDRTEVRRDIRAGNYERKLQTKAGGVKLRIPKLRTSTFETAIDSSVEEAVIETCLAWISVRQVEGTHDTAQRPKGAKPDMAGL